MPRRKKITELSSVKSKTRKSLIMAHRLSRIAQYNAGLSGILPPFSPQSNPSVSGFLDMAQSTPCTPRMKERMIENQKSVENFGAASTSYAHNYQAPVVVPKVESEDVDIDINDFQNLYMDSFESAFKNLVHRNEKEIFGNPATIPFSGKTQLQLLSSSVYHGNFDEEPNFHLYHPIEGESEKEITFRLNQCSEVIDPLDAFVSTLNPNFDEHKRYADPSNVPYLTFIRKEYFKHQKEIVEEMANEFQALNVY